MIVEKFIAELIEQSKDILVIDIREEVVTKPDRGYNLIIEFENGFELKIDGFVSIKSKKSIEFNQKS